MKINKMDNFIEENKNKVYFDYFLNIFFKEYNKNLSFSENLVNFEKNLNKYSLIIEKNVFDKEKIINLFIDYGLSINDILEIYLYKLKIKMKGGKRKYDTSRRMRRICPN